MISIGYGAARRVLKGWQRGGPHAHCWISSAVRLARYGGDLRDSLALRVACVWRLRVTAPVALEAVI